MKIFTIVHIRDGKITNPAAVRKAFNELKDGKYVCEISKYNKRSLPQNDWFHAICPDVMKALMDAGYYEVNTPDKAKEVLKSIFFKKVVSNGVEEIEVIEGTSAVSKEVFSEKAEQIIIWAKEYLNIDIAPPGKPIELF
jgi:hypothetical protein